MFVSPARRLPAFCVAFICVLCLLGSVVSACGEGTDVTVPGATATTASEQTPTSAAAPATTTSQSTTTTLAPQVQAGQALSAGTIAGVIQLAQIGRGELHSVSWSPDGSMVAVATGLGLYLLDGRTLEPVELLPSGYTELVTWSADSTLLALRSTDDIQVWDVNARQKLYDIRQERTLEDLMIDTEGGLLLALGQQPTGANDFGAFLYSAYLDTYSLQDGSPKDSVGFEADDGQLMRLNLSDRGKAVLGAGLKSLCIWDGVTGRRLYEAPLAQPMSATGETNGDVAAIVSYLDPTSVQIIDLDSGKALGEIAAAGRIFNIDLDPSGEKLVLYTTAGYAVYDLASRQEEETVPFDPISSGCRISPDLGRVAIPDQGRVELVDLATDATLGSQEGFEPRAWQVAVGAKNNVLAASKGSSWDGDARLMLVDLDTLGPIATVGAPEFTEPVADLFFTPDEAALISRADSETQIRLWEAGTGASAGTLDLESVVYSAALSADGATVAVGYGGAVELWPLDGGDATGSFYMDSFVGSVSMSADGTRVAASDGALIVVWDAVAQEDVMSFVDDKAGHVDISPDGSLIAASYLYDETYSVRVYDAATGEMRWEQPLAEGFQHLTFSPDGTMVAASAYDDGLMFLDTDTGELLFTLDASVSDFSFSPDSRLLVTASSDGTIRVWGTP